MYMLAGEIIARLAGMSYEAFVRRRIWEPLGLTSAHFCGDPALASMFVTSHIRTGGQVHPIAPVDVTKANPACGLRMNARDLATWLSYFGKRNSDIIPRRTFDAIVTPQVEIGPHEGSRFYKLFGQPDYLQYGFGWFLRGFRGHRLLFHTGRLPGVCTHVALLPDLGFGIVALTNLSYTCLADAMTLTILERFVGGPQTDWMSYYLGVSKELEVAASAPAKPLGGSDCAWPFPRGEDWISYLHHAYGALRVRRLPGSIEFAWANYRGNLSHQKGSSYALLNLRSPLLCDGEMVEFQADGEAVVFLGRRFRREI